MNPRLDDDRLARPAERPSEAERPTTTGTQSWAHRPDRLAVVPDSRRSDGTNDELLVCRVSPDATGMVIDLAGELDLAGGRMFCQTVSDHRVLLALSPTVTIDLAEITFIDCAGLAALLFVHLALRPGTTVHLARPSPVVRRLARLTSLADLLAHPSSAPRP